MVSICQMFLLYSVCHWNTPVISCVKRTIVCQTGVHNRSVTSQCFSSRLMSLTDRSAFFYWIITPSFLIILSFSIDYFTMLTNTSDATDSLQNCCLLTYRSHTCFVVRFILWLVDILLWCHWLPHVVWLEAFCFWPVCPSLSVSGKLLTQYFENCYTDFLIFLPYLQPWCILGWKWMFHILGSEGQSSRSQLCVCKLYLGSGGMLYSVSCIELLNICNFNIYFSLILLSYWLKRLFPK